MPDKAYLSGVEIDTQMDKQNKTWGTDESFPLSGGLVIIGLTSTLKMLHIYSNECALLLNL